MTMIVRELVSEDPIQGAGQHRTGRPSVGALERLADFHEMVKRCLRDHYPMNEVPPELVGHLRFLGDEVRLLQERYRKFLAQELPPARSEVAA